jgi:hypothetical protein
MEKRANVCGWARALLVCETTFERVWEVWVVQEGVERKRWKWRRGTRSGVV